MHWFYLVVFQIERCWTQRPRSRKALLIYSQSGSFIALPPPTHISPSLPALIPTQEKFHQRQKFVCSSRLIDLKPTRS